MQLSRNVYEQIARIYGEVKFTLILNIWDKNL